MLITMFMTLLIISGFFADMIKFADAKFVAIFSFMSLFNTIMFLIFDEWAVYKNNLKWYNDYRSDNYIWSLRAKD